MDIIKKLQLIEELKTSLKDILPTKVADAKVYVVSKFMEDTFNSEEDIFEIVIKSPDENLHIHELQITQQLRPFSKKYGLNTVVSSYGINDSLEETIFNSYIYIGDYGN